MVTVPGLNVKETSGQTIFLTCVCFLLPASAVLGAHGSLWCVWLVPDPCVRRLPAQQTQRSAI